MAVALIHQVNLKVLLVIKIFSLIDFDFLADFTTGELLSNKSYFQKDLFVINNILNISIKKFNFIEKF